MFHVEQKTKGIKQCVNNQPRQNIFARLSTLVQQKYHLQLNHLNPFIYYNIYYKHCQPFLAFIENSIGVKIMPPWTVFGVSLPMYLVPCLKFSHVTYL